MAGTEKWDSARDLAPLQSISWGDESLSLDFYSAVPTFGKDGNYIALLANFTLIVCRKDVREIVCFAQGRIGRIKQKCSSTSHGNGDVTGILVMQKKCFQVMVMAFQVKR